MQFMRIVYNGWMAGNKKRPPTFQIAKDPLLVMYVERIIKERQFGKHQNTVAQAMMWRGIEDLIAKDRIDRIKVEDVPELDDDDQEIPES